MLARLWAYPRLSALATSFAAASDATGWEFDEFLNAASEQIPNAIVAKAIKKMTVKVLMF